MAKKQKRNNKQKQAISKQKQKTSIKEKKNSFFTINNEFSEAYPSVSKIPILNAIAQKMYSEGWYYSLTLLAILIAFLAFGLNHLGQFITTDETAWLHDRVPRYWNALLSGDWKATNITDNPGITHSFLAGLTDLFTDIQNYSPKEFENYLFWWRMPGLIFNLSSLLLIYVFIKRLFDKNYALLVTGIIAFTPIILGMSQIPNSDSTLWNTSFLSILSFLLYLKNNERKYIISSGIFFGLALLSKYAASSIYLFLFAYLYLDYLFKKTDRVQLIEKTKGLLLVFLISTAVFSLFMPAALLEPQLLFAKTFGLLGKPGLYVLAFVSVLYIEIFLAKGKLTEFIRTKINLTKTSLYLINIPLLLSLLVLLYYKLFSDDTFYLLSETTKNWEGAFIPTLMKSLNNVLGELSIPVLIAFFTFLGISLTKFGQEKLKNSLHILVYLLLTIVIYKLGVSSKGVVSGARYDIMLYPIFALIAGIIFLKFLPKAKIIIPIFILIAFADIIILSPLSHIRYTNNIYANFEGRKYSWGMGGYEVAQVANELQSAENLKILSDYHGFSHFFVGKNMLMDKLITADYIKQFDYLCLSSAGKSQKTRWGMVTHPLERYYNQSLDSAEFSIGTLKAGYVKLIKVDKTRKETKISNTFDPEVYLDLKKSNSISFWTKINIETPGNPFFIGVNSSNGIKIASITENKGGILYIYETKIDSLSLSTGNLFDQKWHNVIWYQKGGNLGDEFGLYIDGKKKDFKKLRKEKKEVVKFFISTIYNGYLDDFRIYNFDISENQAKVIYNNGEMTLDKILTENGKEFEPTHHFTMTKK